MAKLSNPLMSSSASGALKKTLLFRNRQGQNQAGKYFYPGSKKKFLPSIGQKEKRQTYSEAKNFWNFLNPEEKEIYKTKATGRGLSGWNQFIKEYFAENPFCATWGLYGSAKFGLAQFGYYPD